jgi:hypothetical protein
MGMVTSSLVELIGTVTVARPSDCGSSSYSSHTSSAAPARARSLQVLVSNSAQASTGTCEESTGHIEHNHTGKPALNMPLLSVWPKAARGRLGTCGKATKAQVRHDAEASTVKAVSPVAQGPSHSQRAEMASWQRSAFKGAFILHTAQFCTSLTAHGRVSAGSYEEAVPC